MDSVRGEHSELSGALLHNISPTFARRADQILLEIGNVDKDKDFADEYYRAIATACAYQKSSWLYCEFHEDDDPSIIPIVWTKQWALVFGPKELPITNGRSFLGIGEPTNILPRESAIALLNSQHQNAAGVQLSKIDFPRRSQGRPRHLDRKRL